MMEIYEKDSDSFTKEYLDYLGTLTSHVYEGKVRLTTNPDGALVRMEVWAARQYYDIPVEGWMEP